MMKTNNLGFLFRRAWKLSKSFFLIITFKGLFTALLPLINIVGLGMVIAALTNDGNRAEIIKLIIIFLAINLFVDLIKITLRLFENIYIRKLSDVAQLEYAVNYYHINYHYIQDNSLDNLRYKAFGSNTVIFVPLLGVLIENIVKFSGVIYIFAVLNPMFLIILLSLSSLMVFLTFKTRKYDYDLSNNKVEDDRKLDYLYDVMTGYKYAKEIRVNNAKKYIGEKFDNIFSKQVKQIKIVFKKSLKINLFSTIIATIQTASMYIYFSYQVFDNQITIAQYSVLLGATTLMAGVLLAFFDNISKLILICERVDIQIEYERIIKKNSEIDNSNLLERKRNSFVDIVIKFENVSFTYPDTNTQILKNINVEIRKDEKLGIVGLNGSGKTTFVKLLTRLYDPTHGRITINGIDIKTIPYSQYISQIAVVLQDFYLFAYSIKDNIIFDKIYDEKSLNNSIEKSDLSDKINNLSKGIDTSVYKNLDDDGVEFSQGEGQKLALARMIYNDAPVFVLDEPTSALDPIAEYKFFYKLNEIAKNKTTVFISHRLYSTKFCDKILVFDNGIIAEEGDHNSLMDNKGIYSSLFNSQAEFYNRKEVNINE